jgi:hypothetical protein
MLSTESITNVLHTTQRFSTSTGTIALGLHDTSQPDCPARNDTDGEPLHGQVSYSLLQLCCAVTMSFVVMYFFRIMSVQTKYIAIRWSKKGLFYDTSMPDRRSPKYTQGMKASYDDPLQMHLALD